MSAHRERAARRLRGSRVFQASAAFGVPHEAWEDCSRMMLSAALRAYQALREWTVAELEALPDTAWLVDSNNEIKPPWWWVDLIGEGWKVGPLRLVFNPNDVKED